MTQISMPHALAGGVSLAVLTLAVMTAANLQTIENIRWRDAPEPVAAPPARPALATERRETVAASDALSPMRSMRRRRRSRDAPTRRHSPRSKRQRRSPLPQLAPTSEGDTSAAAPAGSPWRRPWPTLLARTQAAPAGQPFAADAANEIGVMLRPSPFRTDVYHDQGRDQFETIETNPLKVTAEEPVSTFSIDVDTASYSFMRASLNNGVLPQDDAVRVEELINYFPYDYPGPARAEEPFKATVTVMPTPWNTGDEARAHRHQGLRRSRRPTRPHANLVFLIDTSGSMDEPNKLPLLINSMKLLVDELAARRHGRRSSPTPAAPARCSSRPRRPRKGRSSRRSKISCAGGSTAGAEGHPAGLPARRAEFRRAAASTA